MRASAALGALVAACALTVCAGEAWLNPTGDGDDGSGAAAANDTAAAAASPQLCASSGWRSTALAQRPTASADFKPASADYWKASVVPAAWPAAIGLAAAVALLLLFLLWCGRLAVRGGLHCPLRRMPFLLLLSPVPPPVS